MALTAVSPAARIAWLAGVAGLLIGAVGARLSTEAGTVNFFDNLHWTATTVSTAALGWLAWRRALEPGQRDLLFWMALGVTGYALGQVVWDVQVALDYLPFPAPADALYLTLGPCVAVGLVRALRHMEQEARRQAALLDSAIMVVAGLALTLVLYLPKRGATEPLALLTLIAYPMLMLVAVATMAAAILSLRWRITLPLVMLFSGLASYTVVWMRWNFLALDGQTVPGSWLNISFSVGILMIGFGLTHWDQSISTSPRWTRFSEGVLRQLPFVVVAVSALAVVLAHQWQGLPPVVVYVADIGAACVVVLAMMRQGTLLREHDELLAIQAALQSSQQALLKEGTQLKAVLTSLPDLVWLKDPDGIYLGCNSAFENLFGADEHEIVGKTDYDFVDKTLADFFRSNDKLALQEGGLRRNEERLRFARGGYCGIFETIKTPMRDAEGALVGVLGIARDITVRKHAEEQQAIQAGILASLTEGIHLARADTLAIVYANPQLEELFGYAPGELLGRHVSVLNDPADDGAEETVRRILAALEMSGSWEGDVRNMRKDGTPFWSHAAISMFDHPDHGKVWISVHEDATARKHAEEEVKTLAFYDPLTRLPNRRLMMDRTHQALAASARTGRAGALLLIDLDNFKVLNDTLGHDVGDQLLVSVAHRLSGCVREGDTVARLGGDEFVVILSGLDAGDDGPIQAEVVAGKIQGALNVPHDLASVDEHGVQHHHQHQCSPSIGVCMLDSQRLSVDELLKRADTAMYQAKRSGRNAICFYDPTMQVAIETRTKLEEEIRTAVFKEQFLLYFQPQVDGAGALMGAEVLVRWQHPERGMISPAVFVPLAEETGLILPVGHLVMLGACRQLARWADDPRFARLVLSVNVSARQMSVPTFEQEVMALIEGAGIPPERLKLELTEGLLLTHTEDVIAKMEALRRRGVHFSLDDFGTGYSSLSYLKRLPLDQLKIDQSFVRDLLTDANDEAIAKTVIALGHSLGLHVIAEGVETEDQRVALRAFGCDAYQGYLFGRPMPVAEFEQLVRDWK
ncbi:MAG: EAL domain-containing protein [Rhodocyclaceae bacterium]|nr:EAL domain-containing protein [Rhodocyclaceae bacterium]